MLTWSDRDHAQRGSHVLEGVARAMPNRESSAAPLSARDVNAGQDDPRDLTKEIQPGELLLKKQACVIGCACPPLGLRCSQDCCATTKERYRTLLLGTGQPEEEDSPTRTQLGRRDAVIGQVEPRTSLEVAQPVESLFKSFKRQACVIGCACPPLGLRCSNDCCSMNKAALPQEVDGGHLLPRTFLLDASQPQEDSIQRRDVKGGQVHPRTFLGKSQLGSGLALKSVKRQAPACVIGCACPPFGFRCAQSCCATTKEALSEGHERGHAVSRALLLHLGSGG